MSLTTDSSSHFTLEVVKSFLAIIFKGLRKTHATNLSLAVFGLVTSQSGLLSEIVRGFPSNYVLDVTHKHRLKRLARFLSNAKFTPESWLPNWVSWCVRRFTKKGKLLVALDWTGLPDGRMCLMAAIPFCGRAIPLHWLLTRYPIAQKSQNKFEEQFIKDLVAYLPNEVTPIILADRGFGRGAFFKFLQKQGLSFVIRVRGEVWITTSKGRKKKLKTTKNKPGWIRWYENVTYREDAVVKGLNIAATTSGVKDKDGKDDPWFLVTNLPNKQRVVTCYEARFRIEEFFKDGKHRLGLEDLQTPDKAKVHRLLFVACLSYGLLMLAGVQAEKYPSLQACFITGGRLAASCIWLATKVIRYCLTPVGFWEAVLAEAEP